MGMNGQAGRLTERDFPGRIVLAGASRHGRWETQLLNLEPALVLAQSPAELTAALHGDQACLLLLDATAGPAIEDVVKTAMATPRRRGPIMLIHLMTEAQADFTMSPDDTFAGVTVFDFLHHDMTGGEILFRIRRAGQWAGHSVDEPADDDDMEIVQPVARFRRWEGLIARIESWAGPDGAGVKGLGLTVLTIDRFDRLRTVVSEHELELLLEAIELKLTLTLATHCAAHHLRFEVFHVQDDEFALIFGDGAPVQDVARISGQVLTALKAGVDVDGVPHYLSACAGVALMPGDAEEPGRLVYCAHGALSAAKEKGADNYHFYSSERAAEALQRFDLENRLRLAIKNGEFDLYYQPQVDIASGRISGFEALMRWNHPELGLVFPDTFLPLAREAGLADEIGDFVLARGIEDMARWRTWGLKPMQVALNVTGDMFNSPRLIDRLGELLGAHGVDARYLSLELTEELVLDDIEQTLETMQTLKSLGLKLAIDDFGTGYNSLSYLKFLPFDYLKIDKTFITDLGTQIEDRAMLQAIIGLVKTLDMAVVAEGVETDEQLDYLMSQGCDLYQGYLCAKAMPWVEVMAFVQRWDTEHSGLRHRQQHRAALHFESQR